MVRSRSFAIKIALGFLVSSVAVMVVGIVGYLSIAKLRNNTHELSSTYSVVDRLSELMSNVKDAETGQRGYLLTGDEAYLEPYLEADASVYECHQAAA